MQERLPRSSTAERTPLERLVVSANLTGASLKLMRTYDEFGS
jgi:hypothetical protein